MSLCDFLVFYGSHATILLVSIIMINISVVKIMMVGRRHLARKHSTNYKCAKEGCDKTFAKQYQVRYLDIDIDVEISIMRY